MLLSTEFLRAYNLEITKAEELAHALTMAGLEIDDLKMIAPPFSEVIIVEVIDLIKHPNADKLQIATVNTGVDTLQIVCGAPNVAIGIRVPLAMIGAVLPNDIKIKKGKLRGVESFGMLCSAKELGLSDESNGLLILPSNAPIGANIRKYLELDDKILDVNITPNRADCFSIRGLAREIIAITNDATTLKPLPKPTFTISDISTPKIQNHAPQDCPIYCVRKINDVNIQVDTPEFIKKRLEQAGIRTHDAIVDVTNYVMLELGTPLHAFDAAKINGDIHIRYALDNEKIILLNENEANLNKEFLIIADDKKPLAVAGVMGGLESSCNKNTTDIILESAWFNPIRIAGKARELTLSSDSAQRFERGVDFVLQKVAIDYATTLILEICGGQASAINITENKEFLPQRSAIELPVSDVKKRLGRNYEISTIESILRRLGCEVLFNGEKFIVTPPTWRFDLTIAVDLIEEIARIDGYQNIPDNKPTFIYQSNKQTTNRFAADLLRDLGLQEAITYSFLDSSTQRAFFPEQQAIPLLNPISANLAEMRLSLIPSLLQAFQFNRNRQQNDVRLFEIGRVFINTTEQPIHIAAILSGLAHPEQWGVPAKPVDFFDVKFIVEALLKRTAEYRPSTHEFLHPHQSADIFIDGKKIGYLGALHPQLLAQLGVKGSAIFTFEIEESAITTHYLPQFSPLPKYPSVRRDLALLIDKNVQADALLQAVRTRIGSLLQDCYFFDLYENEKLGEKKSLALAIYFQSPEKTLQDEDLSSIMSDLVSFLKEQFNADLR